MSLREIPCDTSVRGIVTPRAPDLDISALSARFILAPLSGVTRKEGVDEEVDKSVSGTVIIFIIGTIRKTKIFYCEIFFLLISL